jgi:hypothetical protein
MTSQVYHRYRLKLLSTTHNTVTGACSVRMANSPSTEGQFSITQIWGWELVKKFIAWAILLVAVCAASAAMLGAGVANADPKGKTYKDARAEISGWNGVTAALSTVSGDQLDLDDCIVTSWTKSSAVSALGESDGTKALLNLNCNARVAAAGKPGNSAMSPQARVSQFDQCGSCELWGVCDVIGVSP